MNKKQSSQAIDSKTHSDKLSSYSGAIVLGLNDALVEISGALVGLTIALSNSKLIATVGLITGFAAALSMAASEFLAVSEVNKGKPFFSSLLTGSCYIISVLLLVFPYYLLSNLLQAWVLSLLVAIAIIALYNGYISYFKHERFMPRFLKMLIISLGVTGISYVIGSLVKG